MLVFFQIKSLCWSEPALLNHSLSIQKICVSSHWVAIPSQPVIRIAQPFYNFLPHLSVIHTMSSVSIIVIFPRRLPKPVSPGKAVMMQQAAHLHTHTTSFLPPFSFIGARHTGPLFYYHTTTSKRVHLCSLYTHASPFLHILLYSFYFSSLKNTSPPFTLICSQSLHPSLPFIQSVSSTSPKYCISFLFVVCVSV